MEQLTPEQRAELRAKLNEEPQPPMAGWSPDPLKLKSALKYLSDGAEATREELAEYLSSIDEISEISSMDYGLAGRSSNDIFHVEKGDSKADDVLSLTEQGEQLAEMFDEDLDGLRPVEKTLYRGLSLYGHMGAFLGILEMHRQNGGHPDGMLKEEIVDEMEEFYGGEASNYTGYLGTLCDRIELISRTRDGNRARYKLSIPERW
ncbi:hypothetical protein [Haloarcula sp. H-GB5]